jgi:DNA primase
VICHRPFGFLIHGGGARTWCAYVHGGTPPQGRAFREVVAGLAARAGVAPPGDAAARRDERPAILADFLEAACRRLVDDDDPTARRARAALERRGLCQETWTEFELGLTPPSSAQSGRAELRELGLADAQWAHRIVGPWRDSRGELVAVFGRRLRGPGPKYICSRGRRPPLFGLPLRERTPALIVVEGLFDALALRAAGVGNVVAAAGTAISADAWTCLAALGCRDLTLWFDSDAAGQAALLHVILGAASACDRGPQLFVIHPDDAARAAGTRSRGKVDPNSVVLARGRRDVLELLARRWPARIYAALRGAEKDLDQAVLGSLGAPDWNLESILRNVPHLREDTREIAHVARDADTLLEGCLEAGRALRRAGVPAAHVAAELAPRLAQLAREARP